MVIHLKIIFLHEKKIKRTSFILDSKPNRDKCQKKTGLYKFEKSENRKNRENDRKFLNSKSRQDLDNHHNEIQICSEELKKLITLNRDRNAQTDDRLYHAVTKERGGEQSHQGIHHNSNKSSLTKDRDCPDACLSSPSVLYEDDQKYSSNSLQANVKKIALANCQMKVPGNIQGHESEKVAYEQNIDFQSSQHKLHQNKSWWKKLNGWKCFNDVHGQENSRDNIPENAVLREFVYEQRYQYFCFKEGKPCTIDRYQAEVLEKYGFVSGNGMYCP